MYMVRALLANIQTAADDTKEIIPSEEIAADETFFEHNVNFNAKKLTTTNDAECQTENDPH